MLPEIDTPTLLLDEAIVRKNVQRMAQKAERAGAVFRPHFKTHQSIEVGKWFREYGINRITVSSLRMAEYFAKDGWQDITVAFPINVREADRINALLARGITLNLLVESIESVNALNQLLNYPTGVFIKLDLGTRRTGIHWQDSSTLESLCNAIDQASLLSFLGLLGHAGHSYDTPGKEPILRIHDEAMEAYAALNQSALRERYPEMVLSYGDTPTCSLSSSFPNVDELRPGNLTLYDVMQQNLGSCEVTDIAVVVACPVVAKHPERGEIVVYGGGVHMGKDRVHYASSADSPVGQMNISPMYGLVTTLSETGWNPPLPGAYVKSLSQEHGVIHVGDHIDAFEVGGLLGILPIHSCLAVDLADEYYTCEGKRLSIF